ncbi:MAG: hypothetical protein HYV27_04930 [Candidatus Hydrogenedentes bacterium]|nr:hypothetical protein [Candidatus Hydrogenedentota bacterium]
MQQKLAWTQPQLYVLYVLDAADTEVGAFAPGPEGFMFMPGITYFS